MLTLFNSLSLRLEPFEPKEDCKVKMYTCGPSTYQRPHIGNYRTFLFEDILQRYLEYSGYKVTRLITLTNIEDKAIAYAETAGVSVEELTNRNEAIFFKDFEKLNIKRPDFTVRASTIVDQAAKLTADLIRKGIAYKYPYKDTENIYFDPLKFPGFGKLAHLYMKNWPKKKRRFHIDTYPGMPWNRGDFVLWHGCKTGDKVCWNSEVGNGRPAWNIQDAAMVTKHLGFSIDIACGGIDNIVRHHDYTIAAAEAVSGKPLARYWLHGGHLFVDGKKMSKSKGNVIYPENITDKGFQNRHLRFFLIYGAYRERRNFTWQKLSETSKKLDLFLSMVQEVQETKSASSSASAKALAISVSSTFERHMNDNLDVKSAFDALFSLFVKLRRLKKQEKVDSADAIVAIENLRKVDSVLHVFF
jgi:cysteinyl-tRNA synthetase